MLSDHYSKQIFGWYFIIALIYVNTSNEINLLIFLEDSVFFYATFRSQAPRENLSLSLTVSVLRKVVQVFFQEFSNETHNIIFLDE